MSDQVLNGGTMNANQRTALYAVAAAVLPILVSFGLLTEERAPLFLALIGAVLSAIPPVVALRHVTPDEGDDGA